MLDIDGLKASVTLSDIALRYDIDIKFKSGEWVGHCPFHSEKTPSFTITDGKGFFCHGCGVQGNNPIEFTRLINNLPDDKHGFLEAAKILSDMVNYDMEAPATNRPVKKQKPPEPEDFWKQIDPVQDWQYDVNKTVDVYNPKRDKSYPIRYVAAYPYHHADGALTGVILRTERDGRKQFQTITYRTNTQTGEARWIVMAMDAPRPIYGAELIAQNPDAKIMLVEGEKARHAAERLINSPKIIPVAWAGGSKAIEKTDWSLLAGRDVIAWPDCDSKTIQRGENMGDFMPYHDQPGMSAMLKIANLCDAANFKIVRVPDPGNIPDGWDLADGESEGWDRARVVSYMKEHSATVTEILPAPIDEPPLPEPTDVDLYPVEEIHPEDYINYEPAEYQNQAGNGDKFDDGVLKFLGWDNGIGFYMSHIFKQIIALPASSHTRLQLMAMAPLRYWIENFPSTKRGSDTVDWEMAADSLFQRSQEKGVFDPNKLRGRGAWFDDGRSVVHAGDKLIVDGNVLGLSEMQSRYVYPRALPMEVTMEDPMPNSESVKFVRICEQIRWEDPISARLLAGWCFLAPICGAIDWRPHLWLTGPAGSGKSTVIYRIMKPALGGYGGMMIHAAGDTTEAGLRQRLRQDALPVLFDEFESEREKAANRVDDVLALVRQSSSDTGAEIIKGGAGGTADSYLIRSMFAFASIAVGMTGAADESRITVLSMKGSTPEEQQNTDIQDQWIGLNKSIQGTLTEEYIHGLQSRAIKMIPVIRQNIGTFSDAVARSPRLGGKRLGDQVGTLLAGAYSMFSEKPVTLEGALAWIDKQDWSGVSSNESRGDEMDCLIRITAQHVRAEGYNVVQTLTIAELIDTACSVDIGSENIDNRLADKILQRYGVKCELIDGAWRVLIANNHSELGKILSKSGYVGWSRMLARIKGAKKTGAKRFASVSQRAVSLPLLVVRGED